MKPGREEFLRTARLLEDERKVARPIVRTLGTSLDAVWDREIPAAWKTAGFVHELTSAARDLLKNDARATVAMAQFAVVVAASLPAGKYPRAIQVQLEGGAWKELANAHRYLSEYDAALRALDAADRCLSVVDGLGFDRAVSRFARALVLSDQGRNNEALKLVDDCVADFEEHADRRRQAQCLQLRGMIESRGGQYRKAVATYERALIVLDDADDDYTRACLKNNLGQAYGELSDTGSALASLQEALALFEKLQAAGEMARTGWGVGRVLLAGGSYDQAVQMLSGARRDLLKLALPEEAGLAGLDLADAFLATGETAAAREAVEEVVAEFRAAGLNQRALLALDYLRDVLPTPRARAAVRHVRTYINELRTSPNQVFLELDQE
jgi:tetratricopeptide (TPR) repeat protein